MGSVASPNSIDCGSLHHLQGSSIGGASLSDLQAWMAEKAEACSTRSRFADMSMVSLVALWDSYQGASEAVLGVQNQPRSFEVFEGLERDRGALQGVRDEVEAIIAEKQPESSRERGLRLQFLTMRCLEREEYRDAMAWLTDLVDVD